MTKYVARHRGPALRRVGKHDAKHREPKQRSGVDVRAVDEPAEVAAATPLAVSLFGPQPRTRSFDAPG